MKIAAISQQNFNKQSFRGNIANSVPLGQMQKQDVISFGMSASSSTGRQVSRKVLNGLMQEFDVCLIKGARKTEAFFKKLQLEPPEVQSALLLYSGSPKFFSYSLWGVALMNKKPKAAQRVLEMVEGMDAKTQRAFARLKNFAGETQDEQALYRFNNPELASKFNEFVKNLNKRTQPPVITMPIGTVGIGAKQGALIPITSGTRGGTEIYK